MVAMVMKVVVEKLEEITEVVKLFVLSEIMSPSTWTRVMMTKWSHLLIAIILSSCVQAEESDLNDEGKLLSYLFRGYNPSARPVINSSNTAIINLQLSLLQIQELNVKNQVLTTTCLLTLDWTDERLIWSNKTSFLNQLVVAMDNVWKPELAVINGADAIYDDFKEFPGVLRQTGSIRWEPAGVFKTICSIDITYYPFDGQKCELVFGAWSYYTTKMNLTTSKSTVILDSYEGNGEWELIRTGSERREFFFECCKDQRFSNIVFTLHLRRRSPFYLVNVIFPGILTSALLLSVFFCIPSQKVHIGVAALLSFRLFLLNVADNIPRTSDHVPLLVVYLTCTMAITTLAMVATVLVLNLYEIRDRPVPGWIDRLLTTFVDGSTNRGSNITRAADPRRILVPGSLKTGYSQTGNESVYHLMRLIDPEKLIPEIGLDEDRKLAMFPIHESASAPEDSRRLVSPSRDLYSSQHLSLTIRRNGGGGHLGNGGHHGNGGVHHGNGGRRENFSEEWLHLATVCDRLFFWACLLMTVISTLVLFHPLIKYQLLQNSTRPAHS